MRQRLTIMAILAALSGWGGFGATFDIVRGGAAAARFETPGVTNAALRAVAASDIALFNRYLEKVTGAALPTNGTVRNVIRIDLLPVGDLERRFDWRVTFPSPETLVVEATEVSLFSALRQLLEEGCDARFLGVERCMFQFEPRRDAAVEVRPRQSAARSFTLLRRLYPMPGHARELGFDTDSRFAHSHGIMRYGLPYDRYMKEGWPEAIMPVYGGKKLKTPPSKWARWQPCYSNPETACLTVEYVREQLAKSPEMKSISLGINDLCRFCQCPECVRLNETGERSLFANDQNRASESYYLYVNRVAETVEREFPGVKIGLIAYMGTIMPPSFPVRKNVVPMLTLDTIAAAMDPEVTRRQDDVIRRWGEKVPEIGLTDYCWGRPYLVPRIAPAAHAQRLKYLYEQGGRAFYGQHPPCPDLLDGPETYLLSRLVEDIDRDAGSVLDEWYARFAGPDAADDLRTVYRLCEEYWRSPEVRRSRTWKGREWIYMNCENTYLWSLTPGFTEQVMAAARRVREKARTAGEIRRAELLLRHFEILDCVATFRGMAYVQPETGELKKAADAAAMLTATTERLDGLMAAWTRATDYFRTPDFDNGEVYLKKRSIPFEAEPLLVQQVARAIAYRANPAVSAAFARFIAHPALPESVRRLADGLIGGTAENGYPDPSFGDLAATNRLSTTMTAEAVDRKGVRTLKLLRRADEKSAPSVSFSADLPPGDWLLLADVSSPSTRTVRAALETVCLCDGSTKGLATSGRVELPKKGSLTVSRMATVARKADGARLRLIFEDLDDDRPVFVSNVRFVPVRLAAAARRGTVEFKAAEAPDLARGQISASRLHDGERLVVRARLRAPQGVGRVKLAVEAKRSKWSKATRVRTSPEVREVMSADWTEVEFALPHDALGFRTMNYRVELSQARGSAPVEVSRLDWYIVGTKEKGNE